MFFTLDSMQRHIVLSFQVLVISLSSFFISQLALTFLPEKIILGCAKNYFMLGKKMVKCLTDIWIKLDQRKYEQKGGARERGEEEEE